MKHLADRSKPALSNRSMVSTLVLVLLMLAGCATQAPRIAHTTGPAASQDRGTVRECAGEWESVYQGLSQRDKARESAIDQEALGELLANAMNSEEIRALLDCLNSDKSAR